MNTILLIKTARKNNKAKQTNDKMLFYKKKYEDEKNKNKILKKILKDVIYSYDNAEFCINSGNDPLSCFDSLNPDINKYLG